MVSERIEAGSGCRDAAVGWQRGRNGKVDGREFTARPSENHSWFDPEIRGTGYTAKDVPQPQAFLALGFSNTKPFPFSPSEKSSWVPTR